MSRTTAGLLVLSLLLASCSSSAGLLPHSLYFLLGQGPESQIWRLERDGLTLTQITNEPAGVHEFAVSPEDSSLAIISNNQLFLINPDGGSRQLIADGNLVDPNIEDYVFRSEVSSPVFSPDGRILAYGFDGLHLFDLSSGEDEHVLTNLGNLLGEPFVFSREVYVPLAWSPDGSQLLIAMGYYEGSTLAIMEPGLEQPFRRLWSNGPLCCNITWSKDSSAVLVANPYFTGDIPGLWRYDAETGEETVVVPGLNDDNSINFIGWPLQLKSGDLFFFYVNQERFSPDVGIPLTMTRRQVDGTELAQVRAEEFRIVAALWAEDGSLAVIIQFVEEDDWKMVLAPSDGSPLQVLLEAPRITHVVWGP